MIVRSETVFTLHTAHTSYQLAVGPEGVLLHTYYGPRLPDNAPALADGRVPHSDPGCWPDLLPQELSGSGTADNRTPAVVPEYADGTEAAAFVFDRAESHVGKPQLPGLPMFRDGNGVETLSVFLKDAGGLSAEVRYTVYETEDLITRTVVYTNTGAEPLTLHKAASLSLDFAPDALELITLNGTWAAERTPERAPLRCGIQSIGSMRGYYQADACLLMLSVLDDEQYRQLAAVAHSLEMGVLTEVSNEEELERAIALGAKVVGINNRDLRDLSIDLNRTRELAPKLGHNVTVISESGINTYAQVRELSHFANGFLIGSALMAHDDLHAAVRRVLLGENKVCGLTRGQDAKAAYDAGAIYGGLIFVATSPRCVNVEQAQEVMAAAPLQYVGVFRNHDIADVVDKAKVLSLAAVQLHGNEDQLYIDTLREALPAHVAIWKALSVGETLPARELQHVDKYVLDNGQGGSGQRFDWSLLNGQSLGNVLLAGGLGADNCVEAAQTGCAGLDFNSAVESQPGIKDVRLLASVFQTLRAY